MGKRGGWAAWSVTFGDRRCPRCGTPGAPVAQGRWRRLRTTLTHGPGRQPRMRCPDGHEWHAGMVAVLRRGPAWWNLPGRLVRVVLGHRTAEPVPLFWLGVAAAGLATGVLLDVLVGWPWWGVAIAMLVGVWLVFLATAFAPSQRTDLAIDVVGEFSPRRARRMERRRLRRLLAQAPSAPLGVSGWAGARAVGGHGRSADSIHTVELHHGAPGAPPWVAVTTTWRSRSYGLPLRRDLPRRLPGKVSATWRPAIMDVDGARRRFTLLEGETGWAARAQLDDVVIEVVAVGVPYEGLALEPVADLDAYLAG